MIKNNKKQPLKVIKDNYYWDNIYWYYRNLISDNNDSIRNLSIKIKKINDDIKYYNDYEITKALTKRIKDHNIDIRMLREEILEINDDFIAEKMYDDLDNKTITYYDE